MQLKPNTFYRTRGGRKVYCHGQSPFEPDRFVIEANESGNCHYIAYADGQAPRAPQLDLVEEWHELEQVKIWFYKSSVVGKIYGYPHEIKDHGPIFAIVTVKEGQGLGGGK